MNITERLEFFQGMTSCCHNLYFWTYDTNMNLLDMHLSDRNLLNDEVSAYILDEIFTVCQCKDYLKTYILENDMPLLISDTLGLMWISVIEKRAPDIHQETFVSLETQVSCVYVIGPFFVNETALPSIKKSMRQRSLSLELQRNAEILLDSIPTISSIEMFQYAMMFHYCITGERITISQLNHRLNTNISPVSMKAQEPPGNPNPLHLGVWGVEQKLLAMIREGNTNYSSALDSAATISTGVKMKTGDAIRQGKNSIITFVALCSRAAISGGLPPAVSYDLCDFYTEMTEGCQTISELASLSHTMYNDYVQRVHEYQKNTNVSKPVQTCCDYIRMHICEKLSLQDLALVSGYSEYYLSRKFKKETGMTPNEFINHEKIEYAKLLLSTTPDSIQNISDTLNYCSRSYFSSVFQEHAGITPSEYREKNSTL